MEHQDTIVSMVNEEVYLTKHPTGGHYTGNDTSKDKMIHLSLCDAYHSRRVAVGAQRCSCGGWTFSPVWGGSKFLCRHCGRSYFEREYDALEKEDLTPSQREDRRIYAMLLAGGDLREDRVKDVLVLKDPAGLPQGELPMEYARHFAAQYAGAKVVVDRRRTVISDRKTPWAFVAAV